MKGIRGAFVCETRGRAFHVRVSVKRKANATAERAEVNVNLNLSDLSFRSTSWPSSREAKRKKEKRKEKKMAEVWRNEMKLNENASMRQRERIRGKAGRPASGLKTDETWYSSANHFTALCSRDLETVVMTESFLQIPSTTSKEADWCRRLVPRNRSTQFFVHGFSWKNGKLGSILYSYTLAR